MSLSVGYDVHDDVTYHCKDLGQVSRANTAVGQREVQPRGVRQLTDSGL